MRERLRTLTDRLRVAAREHDHRAMLQCRALLGAETRGPSARRAYELLADAHAACLSRGERDAADVLLGVLRERPPSGGPWLVFALAQALRFDDEDVRVDELEGLATRPGPWLDVRRDVYADAMLRVERAARAEHRFDRAASFRERLARLANDPTATPHQRLMRARCDRELD